tara:strand:+ start:545 stop:727 length:183 start_codon:yes stop_codon:yes gene_type:complete
VQVARGLLILKVVEEGLVVPAVAVTVINRKTTHLTLVKQILVAVEAAIVLSVTEVAVDPV